MKLGQVGDRSQKISFALLMSLTVAYGEKKTEKYKNGSNVVSAVLLKDPSDDNIKYDDAEILEYDPDYFECPECGEECEHKADVDGEEYWYCDSCCTAYDDDGDVVYPDAEEEDD